MSVPFATPAPRSHREQGVGTWRAADGTAGGSPACPNFLRNPQYRLALSSRQQDCTITLHQAGDGEPHPIGFVVLRAAEDLARRSALGRPGGPHGYQALVAIRPAAPKAAAKVSSMLKLEREDLPFIIVPYTLEPNCEASYVLEVTSNLPCSLQLLPSKGALDLGASEAAAAPSLQLDDLSVAESDSAALQQVLAKSGEANPYNDLEFSGAAALSAHGAVGDEPAGWEWMRPRDVLRGNGALEAQAELAREAELLPSAGWRLLGPILSEEAARKVRAGDGVLGALAVLASAPHLLRRCFPLGLHARNGVVAVRLWQFDEWILSITDDRLPATDGGRSLLFGSSKEPQLVLLAMLLKAYAKARGGFASLRSVRASELLTDLTGGAPQKLDVFLGTDPAGLDAAALERVWHELEEWLSHSPALVGCEQLAGGRRAEDAKRVGIIPRATYVVLEAVRAGNERLLCLRNPWGGSAWSGRWRAGGPEWMRNDANNVCPLHHLLRGGSAHAAAAVSDRGGIFWMGLRDFCSTFDNAFACRLFPENAPRAVVADRWEGESAGGCLNFASWRHNPQYLLNLSRDCRVLFVLSQPPLEADADVDAKYPAIGLCALRGESRRRRLTVQREDVLGKSPISSARDVAVVLDLPRTTSSRPHVIVPYTFDPGTPHRPRLNACLLPDVCHA